MRKCSSKFESGKSRSRKRGRHLAWRRLKEIDVAAKGERCVILAADEINDQTKIAWYPEQGRAGLLSTNLSLPAAFLPVESCAGFVCGIHTDVLYGCPDWQVRLAVSNPVTSYLAELPILDLSHLDALPNWSWPEGAFSAGEFGVKMTPPTEDGGRLFCVHVVTSISGKHAVHSFNTKTWLWEHSEMSAGPDEASGKQQLLGEMLFIYRSLRCYDVASGQWMVGPGPQSGTTWDADYPVPDTVPGQKYRKVFPFRYGEKIMAACSLSEFSIVLLELILEEPQGPGCKWQVMSALDLSDFHPGKVSKKYFEPWPQIRGDLLVLPCDDCYRQPVAFHLGQRRWIQIPPRLAKLDLALQRVCVYEP